MKYFYISRDISWNLTVGFILSSKYWKSFIGISSLQFNKSLCKCIISSVYQRNVLFFLFSFCRICIRFACILCLPTKHKKAKFLHFVYVFIAGAFGNIVLQDYAYAMCAWVSYTTAEHSTALCITLCVMFVLTNYANVMHRCFGICYDCFLRFPLPIVLLFELSFIKCLVVALSAFSWLNLPFVSFVCSHVRLLCHKQLHTIKVVDIFFLIDSQQGNWIGMTECEWELNKHFISTRTRICL